MKFLTYLLFELSRSFGVFGLIIAGPLLAGVTIFSLQQFLPDRLTYLTLSIGGFIWLVCWVLAVKMLFSQKKRPSLAEQRRQSRKPS